jgi:thioredoxin 1
MADVTDQTFQQDVLQSEIPVLVDFWAPWCTPCRMVTPIIHELADEYKGKVKVFEINVDENPQSAEKYSVLSIPSILIFKNGQPVKTMVGAQGKESFKKGIDEVLSAAS